MSTPTANGTGHGSEADESGQPAGEAFDQAEPGTGAPSGRSPRRRLVAVLVAVVVVLGLLGAGGLWWATRGLPDDAAFEMGEQIVTETEVDQRIEALQALYGLEPPTGGDDLDTFRRDAAKSMAVAMMLEKEAERLDVSVPASEVDDTVTALVEQRYPDGGRQAFVAALGEMGASEDQVRSEIRQQLLVSRLFGEVTGEVEVSAEDVTAAFGERRDQLGTPERRRLRNVVVQTRAEARQVLREVQAGADVAAVARSRSLDRSTRASGGSIGTVAAEQLEDAYAEAAFAAPEGGVFGPVQTRFGWNVGQVEEVLPPEPAVLAEVRGPLRQSLLAEQSVEVWRDWLEDVLGRHDVEYADDYRPEDPDEVPDIGGPPTPSAPTP